MSFTTLRRLLAVLALLGAGASAQYVDLNTQSKGSRMPFWGTDTGTANTYQVATVQAIGSGGVLQTGSRFYFKAANANTGASTLAVNGGTAIAIKKNVSLPLTNGDIAANQVIEVVYDGVNFQFIAATPNLIVKRFALRTALCTNAVANPALNQSSGITGAGPVCSADNQQAGLAYADSDKYYFVWPIPDDYTSLKQITLIFSSTDVTNGHTIIWSVATFCIQANSNVAEPNAPTYNGATTATTSIGASAANPGKYSAVLSSISTTGCSASTPSNAYEMRVLISRSTDTASGAQAAVLNEILVAYNGSNQ